MLPEHTREAYLAAIAQGVDGLECDVRLTRDGELVCIHDALIDRTSNGKGRVSGSTREERAPFGANLLGPGLTALRSRPEIVQRAHERGHQVYVWTVNDRADIDLMLSLGVDGIISDRPADVLERLAHARQS